MKKILEVGGGTTPYFVRFNIPWNEQDSFACIDVNEKRLEESKSAIERIATSGESYPNEASFLLCDGVDISLPDMSCDEVVLSNVLSAPIHYNWNEAGDTVTLKNKNIPMSRPIMGKKEDGDLFYRERKPVIKEALRVLKPGGKLSIYTDLLIYGQHSFEKIIEELKSDISLIHSIDEEEQKRIDELNIKKKKEGTYCFCFDADVLPQSSVVRFKKIY
jgi:ubiquinone/menaquinone biosynthesis C-methylase UbiE